MYGGRAKAKSAKTRGSSTSEIRLEADPLSETRMISPGFCAKTEGDEIVITRYGRPAGVLIGFSPEDDWLDYQLENDSRFSAPRRAGAKELAGGARRQA